jgi:hypothetical protein
MDTMTRTIAAQDREVRHDACGTWIPWAGFAFHHVDGGRYGLAACPTCSVVTSFRVAGR